MNFVAVLVFVALASANNTYTPLPSFNLPSEPVLASPLSDRPVKVLVFGDSYGDTGPTYRVIEDVFKKYNVSAQVTNYVVAAR
jgi:hypothetical protein